jgi:hypothetical protein
MRQTLPTAKGALRHSGLPRECHFNAWVKGQTSNPPDHRDHAVRLILRLPDGTPFAQGALFESSRLIPGGGYEDE